MFVHLINSIARHILPRYFSIAPAVGAALLGGGISLVGGFLGNSSAKKEAAKSRAYDERVRKNSHQWEVDDLEAAGLNKVLSASHGGGGASTPVANVGNPAKDVVSGAASASSAAVTKELLRKEKALADIAETESWNKSKEREFLDMPMAEMKQYIDKGKVGLVSATPRMVSTWQTMEQQNETIKNLRANSASTMYDNAGKSADAEIYEFIDSLGPSGKFLGGAYRAWREK